jgi:ribosomal protein L37E
LIGISPHADTGRCSSGSNLLDQPEARCRSFDRSVSSDRPPNRRAVLSTGLSTSPGQRSTAFESDASTTSPPGWPPRVWRGRSSLLVHRTNYTCRENVMSTENSPVLDRPALWSAQAHLPSVLGRQLVVDRGEGCYVFTRDGRRLFDGTAGLWHAHSLHRRRSHYRIRPTGETSFEKRKQACALALSRRSRPRRPGSGSPRPVRRS